MIFVNHYIIIIIMIITFINNRPSNSVLIYNNDDVNNYIFCICEASTIILLFKFIYKTRVGKSIK